MPSEGPYHEGSEVILVCEAGGGKPTPQVLNFDPKIFVFIVMKNYWKFFLDVDDFPKRFLKLKIIFVSSYETVAFFLGGDHCP